MREIRAEFLGMGQEVARQDERAVLGAQPRHRFVIADLALRQRHDRLQIEIDAIVVDRALQDRCDLVGALALERSGGGQIARRRRRLGVSETCGR